MVAKLQFSPFFESIKAYFFFFQIPGEKGKRHNGSKSLAWMINVQLWISVFQDVHSLLCRLLSICLFKFPPALYKLFPLCPSHKTFPDNWKNCFCQIKRPGAKKFCSLISYIVRNLSVWNPVNANGTFLTGELKLCGHFNTEKQTYFQPRCRVSDKGFLDQNSTFILTL